MFKGEVVHQHSHSIHYQQHEHYEKDVQLDSSIDPSYPEERLEAILKGLEERVYSGKNNLNKLQCHRYDLQFELKGLQDEKMVLDSSLAQAKDGEALVRERERQINEEFAQITSDRHIPDPGPLIKRTLILGRELFALLLRDVAIEDTARKAFEIRVSRIQFETAKKAAERTQLQERVLSLQTECEVDLEQKRQLYDEIQILQKRSESLDAQIAMLVEWRKSLENQILYVRAATEKRLGKHNVEEFGYGDVVHPIVQANKVESVEEESDEKECWCESPSSASTEIPEIQESVEAMKECEAQNGLFCQCDDDPVNQTSKVYQNDPATPPEVLDNFMVASIKDDFVKEKEEDSDTECVESKTSIDGNESSTLDSDESMLTMRTSRSLILNLSSSEQEIDDDDDDDFSSALSTNEPLDKALNQLRAVQNMPIPSESSTTVQKPFKFEVWSEVLPNKKKEDDANENQ